MGNYLSKDSDSEYFSDEDLGNIWHDTTTDDEDDEESLLETTVARQSAGGVPAGSASVKSQQSQKPSEKPSDKLSAKPTEKEAANESWKNDLCGIEDGPKWEGPQRIKTSQLDEAKKAYFQKLLDRLFNEKILMGRRVQFLPDEISDVIEAVIPLLESEPMLIEDVPFDITIVGDLHGQFHDLNRIFGADSKDGKPGWECMKYLFLGDYVDRGRQSIEVMMALFIIKCMHPDRIFLLRGSHEFYRVNKKYGFWFDFCEQYADPPTVKYLYLLFNEAFAWMSIAAIVGNIYFCAHGGIATSCFTRRHMRGLYKPVFIASEHNLITDIIWSDPAPGLRGTAFNRERGISIFFGFDELCKALASMEVVAIFRGHSQMENGYAATWNCCFTVFSATNYDGKNSSGAVAYVGPTGKVQMWTLETDSNRVKWEKKLEKLEYVNCVQTEAQKKEEVVDTVINGTGRVVGAEKA